MRRLGTAYVTQEFPRLDEKGPTVPSPSPARRASALLAAITAAAVLVSCSASPAPAPAPSAEPVAETTPAAPQPVDAYPDDDFVPLEVVEDEYGVYTRMTLDPDSELRQLPDAPAVDNLIAAGAERADLETAWQTVVIYLVENFLDGTRLDNYAQDEDEWYEEYGGVLWERTRGLLDSGMTITDYGPEPLNRTGAQRVQYSIEALEPIASDGADGAPVLTVGLAYEGAATTTDDAARAAITGWTSVSGADLSGRTPALFDDDPSAELRIAGHAWYWISTRTPERVQGGKITVQIYEADSGLTLHALEPFEPIPTDY